MSFETERGSDPQQARPMEPRPREHAARRPYRKPAPELRGQIKPSLLGSPPSPP